jgi:hypothetical protein
MTPQRRCLVVLALFFSVSCSSLAARRPGVPDATSRNDNGARAAVLARAQLWRPVTVRAMDVLAGPQGPASFRRNDTVVCDYLDKKLSGRSPKFACRRGEDDELKVKYGGTNGEVYAELLATRLLWALGFGADAMYPVNVICRGCPQEFGGIERPGHEYRFDPAVVERKMMGNEWPSSDESGWSWEEVLRAVPRADGAPKAHRDALALLAVMLQHTDTKPQQQRILCLGGVALSGACNRPFLMISDVGLTFGGASRANTNEVSGANLERWRTTPVWKDVPGCVGNLDRSFTGTLHEPVISEGGRRFLATLLQQLTDRQLRDLFTVGRVTLRMREPGRALSGFATVDEWVAAFKAKRDEITSKRCA